MYYNEILYMYSNVMKLVSFKILLNSIMKKVMIKNVRTNYNFI